MLLQNNAMMLDLSQRGIDAARLRGMVQDSTAVCHLTCVKLGYNDIKDEGVNAIASVLDNNMSITSLDLGFNNIGDRGIATLATSLLNNRTLKTLYLTGNRITHHGFRHIAHLLKHNRGITALYLSGNHAGCRGAEHLAEALTLNTTLETLHLGAACIGSAGVTHLSLALTNNRSLRRLYLSDNFIGDAGCKSIGQALLTNRNIEALQLSFNGISALGMESLMNALYTYSTMTHLALDNNKLEDTGAKLLGNILPTLNLLELNVAYNNIHAGGIQSIMKGLHGSNLSILILSGNDINSEAAKDVAQYISMNRSLEHLYLDNVKLSAAGNRSIASSIAANRFINLQLLTGMELGPTLVELGSPKQIGGLCNRKALLYLSQLWKLHMSRSQQQGGDNNTTSSQQSHHVDTPKNKRPYQPEDSSSSNRNITPSLTVITASPAPAVSSYHPKSLAFVKKSLHVIAQEPYCASKLWELHQYYYNPPLVSPNHMNSAPPSPLLLEQWSTDSENDVISGEDRPVKRGGCRNTLARITAYPRIKDLKAKQWNEKILTILRQLQFFEAFQADEAQRTSLFDFDIESFLTESL